MSIAGDNPAANEVIAKLHDKCGLDVVDTGRLEDSWHFECAKPASFIPFDAAGLQGALNQAKREEELTEGSSR